MGEDGFGSDTTIGALYPFGNSKFRLIFPFYFCYCLLYKCKILSE